MGGGCEDGEGLVDSATRSLLQGYFQNVLTNNASQVFSVPNKSKVGPSKCFLQLLSTQDRNLVINTLQARKRWGSRLTIEPLEVWVDYDRGGFGIVGASLLATHRTWACVSS